MQAIRATIIGILLALAPMCGLGQGTETSQASVAQLQTQTESTESSGEHALSQKAQALRQGGFITNSMIVTWIVALGLIIFANVATRNMKEVPDGAQNFWEWLVESLYDFLASILGLALTKKTFWFLATIFIFILFTNWFGLIPGVGTIGWGIAGEHGFEVTRPLLRGGNADVNMPLAMATIFFVLWIIWAFQANGLKGFVLHLFGPKGEISGVIGLVMIIIFIAVGFLEVISIFFRPIALTFRLYGNMFAGENLLEAMSNLIQNPAWARAAFSVFLPIPFYFMELLVGFVQALVFMLLCSVFTAVICVHEEEPGKAHH